MSGPDGAAPGSRPWGWPTVYVPLWGVAVGILTLGILVPMNTTFSCAQ